MRSTLLSPKRTCEKNVREAPRPINFESEFHADHDQSAHRTFARSHPLGTWTDSALFPLRHQQPRSHCDSVLGRMTLTCVGSNAIRNIAKSANYYLLEKSSSETLDGLVLPDFQRGIQWNQSQSHTRHSMAGCAIIILYVDQNGVWPSIKS